MQLASTIQAYRHYLEHEHTEVRTASQRSNRGTGQVKVLRMSANARFSFNTCARLLKATVWTLTMLPNCRQIHVDIMVENTLDIVYSEKGILDLIMPMIWRRMTGPTML
jgi:hypothetical protein